MSGPNNTRAPPRKPDWLLETPPGNADMLHAGSARQTDTTVRVLEFPGTLTRNAATADVGMGRTGATLGGAAATTASLRPRSASTVAPPRPAPAPAATPLASTLSIEPAYKSALARLTKGTAPGPPSSLAASRPLSATSSIAASAGASHPAAPLPSSRLDALLAGRPTSNTARPPSGAAQPVNIAATRPLSSNGAKPLNAATAQLPSSRLDALLASKPKTQAAPTPSTRLDTLLAKPAAPPRSAATVTSNVAACSTAQPPVRATLSSAHAARAQHPKTGQATAAALSPVAEEDAAHPASSASPAGQAQHSTAAEGFAARPGVAVEFDSGLQERLRQRVEEAKVQIRQQLSPMFRLSQALLGTENDPIRAADALEAATGLSSFERLAMRPSSRGAAAASTAAPDPGWGLSAGGSAGGSRVVGDGEQQLEESHVPALPVGSIAALQQQQQQQEPAGGSEIHLQQEQHGQGAAGAPAAGHAEQHQEQPAAAAATATATASRASSSSKSEARSLASSAMAAAGRAQSDIADLASPVHQLHQQQSPDTQGQSAAAGAGESAPRSTVPAPFKQLTATADAAAAAVELGGQLAGRGVQLVDVDGWVEHLKQQAEILVRSECEHLVASLQAVFDNLLDSLQQHTHHGHPQAQQQQQQQHNRHQQQQEQEALGTSLPPPAEAAGSGGGYSTASSYGGSQLGSAGGSPRAAATPASGLGSRGSGLGGGGSSSSQEEEGHEAAPLETTLVVDGECSGDSNAGDGSEGFEGEVSWPGPVQAGMQQEGQLIPDRQEDWQTELGQLGQEEAEQQGQAWLDASGRSDALGESLHDKQQHHHHHGQQRQRLGELAAPAALGHLAQQQHPQQQQQQRPPPRQVPVQLAAALAAAGGSAASFGGFGSPIRLPHHPSPVKPAATASALGRPSAATAAVRGSLGAQPVSPPPEQQGLAATAKSLSFGARPAASGSEYATPLFDLRPGSADRRSDMPPQTAATSAQPLRSGLDGYLTARSTAAGPGYLTARSTAAASGSGSPRAYGGTSPSSTRSSSGWPAASPGDSSPASEATSARFGSGRLGASAGTAPAATAGAAATPGAYYSSLSSGGGRQESVTPPDGSASSGPQRPHPLLSAGAGGRDLEGITASIRRLAAEMRLKHGALATPLLGSRPSSAGRQQHAGTSSFQSAHSHLGRPARPATSGGGSGGPAATSLYRKPPR